MTDVNKKEIMTIPPHKYLYFTYVMLCLLALAGCKHIKPVNPDITEPQKNNTRKAQIYISEADIWIGNRFYGFAGEETNMSAIALNTILTDQDSKNILLDLLDTAHTAGKLYALCGLYHVAPDFFTEAVENFRNNTNIISTIIADTPAQERICDIVFSPYGNRKGETNIVLRHGQTVSEWLKQNSSNVRPFMDISGGSIPMILRYGLDD